MLTEKQGSKLVDAARKSLESLILKDYKVSSKDLKQYEYMKEKKGVFVTLKNKDGGLRGCIGRPYPTERLIDAVLESSRDAARDPRFPQVNEKELGKISLEVTVLTKPRGIDVKNLEEAEKQIELGKHGLIIKGHGKSGLLLPQVPEEHGMNLEEFLGSTCLKAGLSREEWKKRDIEVYKFRGQVFKE